MSRYQISRMSYDTKNETLTIIKWGNYSPLVITADSITEAPVVCESNHAKIMYSLYTELVQSATFKSTVSAKFKDAYMVANITSKENSTDIMADENFSVFLDAIDNGSKSLTKGEYIVEIQYRDFVAYHKNAKGATRDKAFAKVFKTLEHAKDCAMNHGGKVVAL